MDQSTRRVVFPELYGVKIRGVHTGKEIPLPTAPRMPQNEESGTFTVPYSYVDLNGHMNNTRYFDLAEDLMPDALHARKLVEVQTEYAKEAPRGAKLLLKSELQGDAYLLYGESDGQRLFRLGLTFAPIGQ
jgi:acyl-ACP thioesterase